MPDPRPLTPEEAREAAHIFGLYGQPDPGGAVEAQIKRWQARLGVAADGRPGPITRAALQRLSPPAPSAPRPAWHLNEAPFFAHIRSALFRGQMTQSQVEGIQRLLTAWQRYGTGDARHLAYVLATSYWETGRKMQPVPEVGKGRDKRYGRPLPPYGHVYYGRGDVQLTWQENYQKMGRLLGLDLVQFPDLALRPDVSARILIEGMTAGVSRDGDFTGKSLEDYTVGGRFDPIGARRVVNGTDRAREIAGFYAEFLKALDSGGLPLLTRVEA